MILESIRINNMINGSGSPIGVITPDFIGQTYIDTVSHIVYFSKGLTNADWIISVGTTAVVKQAIGTSTEDVMSQKAVTDEFSDKFERIPELVTSKTTGYYYGNNNTTLKALNGFTACNLIPAVQGDVLVVQGISAETLAVTFQGREYNASNNYTKQITAADFIPITGGYKITIGASTTTQVGFHVLNADAATISFKRAQTVAETLIWKLKQPNLPIIPDFVSALTKTAINDQLFVSGTKARFVGCVIRTYAHIPFDTGSRLPLNGETLVGATSGKSYVVHSVKLDSGSWASGNAVGHIVINARSNYLSNPYTDLENLTIGGTTVARRSSVAVFGGWEQVDGDHTPMGVASFETTSQYVKINYNFTATKVCTFVACPDEGWNGYTMGASVGLTFSYLYIKKLTANTTTGEISGTYQDYSSLANCTSDDNIWVMGMMFT